MSLPEIAVVEPRAVTPELIVVVPVQLLVPVRLNRLPPIPAKVTACEVPIAWPAALVPLPEVMLPLRMALPPNRFSNTTGWPFSTAGMSSTKLFA